MNLKKSLSVLLATSVFTVLFSLSAFGQERPRVIVTDRIPQSTFKESSPIGQSTQQAPQKQQLSRPVLTNQIVVVGANNPPAQSYLKKTGSSLPTNAAAANNAAASSLAVSPMVAMFNQRLRQSMDSKLGIRYVYGSTGPYTYDCSGLVWSVFNEAGLNFERTSARNYWEEFEPVSGDERYKFGTLVFFNGLGHVGIVVNEKGFYHASSSKGVSYASFEGYWENRIVGFRRIPLEINPFQ